MKILRTRAASVSRQGLCTALLVASLTAAVGVSPPHNTAGADDSSPRPSDPQGKPHGVPNLALPDLAPKNPGNAGKPGGGTGGDAPDGNTGIPKTALAAYQNAARLAATQLPGCHIPWELIAGIGRVESVHAGGYGLRSDGSTEKPIRGPRLTGGQFAEIRDTDKGRWDGDTEYDRAVGPTQFIPSTWEMSGADGNGDGIKDPNNIFDAALGTAHYLCANNRDLNSSADLDKAVLSYNQSREYVTAVLAWMRTYQSGNVGTVPDNIPTTPHDPSGDTPGKRPTTPSPGTTPGGGSTTTPPSNKPSPGKQTPSPQKPSPNKPTPKPDPKPDPGKPDPGKPDPKPDPTKPIPSPVSRLERMGAAKWETTTGEVFEERASVKALDKAGKPVAGARVVFEIIGQSTGATFLGGAKKVTATTLKDGIATSPSVLAGATAGQFPLRATVEGKDGVTPVDFNATVKPAPAPHADKIERVGNECAAVQPNSPFDCKVVIQASKGGKAVAGIAMTATVASANGDKAVETGPYFKDKNGQTVRKFDLGKTDGNGRIELPEFFADGKTGAYTLRIVTTDGQVLLVYLNVEAKKSTPQPSTTPSSTPKS
ncbi:lytic transglycosylase domain-containing protein [Streptomyces syringium]|uniref:lytic transglycosylase domain-containing protein n=1 Tax=Streptomyces syringium TaxID=76729 RepID=UPI003AAE5B62